MVGGACAGGHAAAAGDGTERAAGPRVEQDEQLEHFDAQTQQRHGNEQQQEEESDRDNALAVVRELDDELPNIFKSAQSSKQMSRSETFSSGEQEALPGISAEPKYEVDLLHHFEPVPPPRTLEQKHGVMDYPARDLMFEYVFARKSQPQSTRNSASKFSLAGTPSLGPRAASAQDQPARTTFDLGNKSTCPEEKRSNKSELNGSVLVARLDEMIQNDVEKRYPNLMATMLQRSKTSGSRHCRGMLTSPPPGGLERSRTSAARERDDRTWLHALEVEKEYLKNSAASGAQGTESWRSEEGPAAPQMAPRGFSDYAYRTSQRRNMVFYRGDYCFDLEAIEEDQE